MEVTGELKNVSRDWQNNKIVISFAINENLSQESLDNISNCKLAITAKKWREKRSRDANAYFHVLVGKLADVLRISKPRCKNILIQRYGQAFLNIDDTEAVIKSPVPPSQMLEMEEPHCFPCGSVTENGVEMTLYKMYRGSRTYDTREMSILIDGTIEECKEQGIETMTPNELARLKSLWGAKNG